MYTAIAYSNYDCTTLQDKSIVSLLTDCYLDCSFTCAKIFANHNLCGHRQKVCIIEINCLNGLVTVKKHANMTEARKAFLFGMASCDFNNKISVIWEGLLEENKYDTEESD